MKKIILLCVLCASVTTSFAQRETFDLAKFTPPKDWKKEITENVTSYTIVNKKNNTWCRIGIIKSTTSKGNIEQDFESEWQELIVKNYNPTEAPQLNEVHEAEGWKIKTGAGKFTFNNASATAMLTTMTGYNRCVSIVATTNTRDYIKDIEALLSSVDLKKPETTTQPVTGNGNNNTSIAGTWCISASDQSGYSVNNGINGYIIKQYTFNTNGTYSFITKTFQYVSDKLLLVKEIGTYQISGSNITISPQKSVIQAWSKDSVADAAGRKSGTDNWGKLLNTQKITPEKVTYQFTKHYFSGIQEWDLVLQAGKATKRDGPFNGGTAFSNAWIYSPVSTSHPLIKLPD